MIECINEWMNEWMYEWMNEWMSEWMNECVQRDRDAASEKVVTWLKNGESDLFGRFQFREWMINRRTDRRTEMIFYRRERSLILKKHMQLSCE